MVEIGNGPEGGKVRRTLPGLVDILIMTRLFGASFQEMFNVDSISTRRLESWPVNNTRISSFRVAGRRFPHNCTCHEFDGTWYLLSSGL